MDKIIGVTVIPVDDLQADLPEWAKRVIEQWLPPGMGGNLEIYSEIHDGVIIQHFDLVSAGGGICATGEMPQLCRYITRNGIGVIARGSLLASDELGFCPDFLGPNHRDSRLLESDEAAWLLNVEQSLVDLLRNTAPAERLTLFRQSVPFDHCANIYNEAIRAVHLL